jgi:uncharacterized membrane protein
VVRLGFALCIIFGLVKTCIRYWLFRPVHARPALVRSNEVLRLLDLGAVVALIGAFFLLANQLSLARAAAWIAGLVVYDLFARRCFLEIEVRRLCAKSAKWSHRNAMRHIKRRAQSPMFH